MGVPMTLNSTVALLLLLILTVHGLGLDHLDYPTFPEGRGQTDERDALYVLKHAFNHPLLNVNWDGFPCSFMNRTNTSTWIGISCSNGRVIGISLEDLSLTGQIDINALVNLSRLTHLSFRNNSISGVVMDFSATTELRRVDLSLNRFTGPISPSLVGLGLLESLQLQNNSLTGQIPPFGQPTLLEFNVSDNNLSGIIPLTPQLQSFSPSSYSGNPGLCGPPSPITCKAREVLLPYGSPPLPSNPPTGIPHRKKKDSWFQGSTTVLIFALSVLFAAALATYFLFVYLKKEKPFEKGKESSDSSEMEERSNEEKVETLGEKDVSKEEKGGKLSFIGGHGGFELNDLLKASAEGLGKGSFGASYKAMMEGRPPVVVKRLRDLHPLSGDEFTKQMRQLSEFKHPNLLSVIAYYHSRDEQLMVCKFAQNGNLYERIHGGQGTERIPFKWKSRVSVAQGVGRAMAYLHMKAKSINPIPHGNLKSTNVLFDDDGNALVSDYGLSSLIAPPVAVQRLVAYKSPEHQNRRKVSRKSDVWSYGCLLLEIITGRISSHSAPEGIKGVDLGNWVHKAVREEWTAEIFDVEITVQRRATQGALRLLQIAIRCCDKLPEKRPVMEDVVREVEALKADCDRDQDDDEGLPSPQSFTDESISSNGS